MNNTALATSPWVMPGMYTAKLTVNGKIHTHIFEVKMDPRVKTGVNDLQQQHDLSLLCYNNIKQCMKKLEGLNENSEPAKILTGFINKFKTIHSALQESDMVPTMQMIKASKETTASFTQFFKSLK